MLVCTVWLVFSFVTSVLELIFTCVVLVYHALGHSSVTMYFNYFLLLIPFERENISYNT